MHAENRRTAALALPIVAGFLGQMLMGVVDTVMLGRVGVVELAACAFANTVLSVPLVFGFGLLAAVSIEASHAYGAGRLSGAGEALRGGLVLAAGMGLAMGVGGHVVLPWLGWMGQPAEVVGAVGGYFTLCAWSFGPIFATGAAKNFSESLGRPWPPFWIMIGGVLLNVGLNWVFIFGNLGAPRMGLDGAGLATLLARVATMAGMGVYVMADRGIAPALPVRWIGGGLAVARRLLGVGLPTGGLNLCEVSGFAFGSLMMGWLGVVELAAHQVALTCAATTFMVPLGLGQAACVRVGHARGAGRCGELPAIVGGVLGMTAGVGVCFAAGYLLCGGWIAGWFSADAAVVGLAARLLMLAGLFQVFDGVQIVSAGALRGYADTRVPFLIGLVAYWGVALPVSWVAAFRLGFGAEGIWAGFVAGLLVAAVAQAWRLARRTRSEARQGGAAAGRLG
jgi:multidrug resistance protein, MATE family